MMPPAFVCNNCGADNQPQAAYCRSCGYSLQAVKPTIYHSTTGQLLTNSSLKQRYRIIAPIGKGGMGTVYQTEDTQLGNRKVAVKEMSQSGLHPQELKEAADAFRQEAIILARLHHPNLPSIFDHFEENGRWYLVMSFIKGETLDNYLSKAKNGKLPLDEVLQIGMQLCMVLGYLHNQQPAIIFRDLKPSNIMRTPDGHIYLIDFGIARHFKPGQAKDTAAYGSMGYASPEQYGKATTPRSDIYSLGVVLYQLLSGHNPSTTPFRFPPLQSLVPTVPMELATLITHMLELDENKRPTSVLVVSQKLQNLITSPHAPPQLQPTMAAGRPSLSPMALPLTSSKKIRPLTLLIGILSVIILGSGLVYFASSYRAPFGSNPSQTLLTTSTPQPNNSSSSTFVAKHMWKGQANQYDNGEHYPMVLNVDTIQDAQFSGTLSWPTLNNSITTVNGTIVTDFGDSTEKSRWQFITGFNSGAKGTWLKFTETNLVQGSNIVLNLLYYALARDDGTIDGVWFYPNQYTPNGDYFISQKP